MNTHRIGRVLLAGTMLCLAAAAAPAQQYSMTTLAPYAGIPNTGMNNLGDVVGYSSAINNAFLYSGGTLTPLGLGYSTGTATNNLKQIVLYSTTAYHSYLLSPPNVYLVDLGTLGGGGGLLNRGITTGLSINDSGTIVGYSNVNSTTYHAFQYARGRMTDLGTLGTTSAATSINSYGQVVGYSLNSGGYQRAFQMVNGVMTDLDPANPTYDSGAMAINDLGQIVVQTNKAWCRLGPGPSRISSRPSQVACRGSYYYTLLYSGSGATNIGNLGTTLGTYGNGVDKYGSVVGMTYPANSVQHAFLYRAGTMLDLNNHVSNLGTWSLWSADHINDLGQIVCLARAPDGTYWSVLLSPTGPPA